MYLRPEISPPELGAPEPGAAEPEAPEDRATEPGAPLPDLDHNAGMGGKSGACSVFVGLTPQTSQVSTSKKWRVSSGSSGRPVRCPVWTYNVKWEV